MGRIGRMVPLLVPLAACLTYLMLWSDGPYEASDSSGYTDIARDLADGRLDRLPFRSLGYPLFLLLTGNAVSPGRGLIAAQLLLFLAGLYGLAGLLRELGARKGLVTAFLCLGALPHVSQSSAWVLTEGVAQAALSVGFACFGFGLLRGRSSPLLAAGIALALGAAVRREFTLAAMVLAVCAFRDVQARRVRSLLSPLKKPILVLLPTLLLSILTAGYLSVRFGERSSPYAAMALALRMGDYLESIPEEYADLREILVKHRNLELIEERHHRVNGFVHAAWGELVELYGGDEEAARRDLARASLEALRREPRNYILSVWRSFARYWEWHSTAVPGLRPAAVSAVLLAVHFASVGVVLAGGALMLLFWTVFGGRGRSRELLLRRLKLEEGWREIMVACYGLILTMMVVHCAVGLGPPRLRQPLDLLVVFLVMLLLEIALRIRDQVPRLLERDSVA